MRRKSHLLIIPFIILSLLFSCFAETPVSLAESEESYAATTMRLLRYNGAVQIFDVSGAPRFLLENVRFASGESMETGEDGSASVALDDSKIVTLDAKSFVEFIQESDHIRLNLKQGAIFLDVSEKLDENAGLDIQTSTMTVGIRGTVVQVSEEEDPEDPENLVTMLGVMEGITNVTYTDQQGSNRLISVSAGQKIAVPRKRNAQGRRVNPVVSNLTSKDIKGVSRQQVINNPRLLERITGGSPNVANLILGGDSDSGEEDEELFPAEGEWTYDGLVTLVAQSASKLYDSTPLTRPEALVSGLPAGLKIDLKVEGSITDAGRTKNTVTAWTIYNSSGQDVTSHITNVQTSQGDLVVDPAPIYVWTGSAEKYYDGEPLTCDEAEVHTIEGHVSTDPDWKNSSIVTNTALGSERMVALSGSTLVHGTNPLTGETKETTLLAGQALTVALHSDENGDSIEYVVEDLTEATLPVEAVRLYADNPDLLAAACAETGWDPAKIRARARFHGGRSSVASGSKNGLKVSDEDSGNIVINSTNVRINVDSDFISYDSRALDSSEAKFSPIKIDPSIKVTATGSQLEVGESLNTCSIDWGNAKSSNYTVRQDLGTLKILAPEKPLVSITSGSGEKTYDGSALEISTMSVSGLPAGYTARAIYTGTQTDVGSSPNTLSSWTILDGDGEIVTDQFTVTTTSGTLTVTPAALTVTTGSDTKPYDGEPLTCDEASISGLVKGETATVTATGSQTKVGSSDNTYTISWVTAKESNYTVTEDLGTLEVTEAENETYTDAVTVSSDSKSAVYSGGELTAPDYTVTGLPDGFNASAEVTGSRTDVGSSSNTIASFTISKDGEDVTSRFTNITLSEGTLEVTPATLTVTTGSGTKTYDGEALTCDEASLSGLVDGETAAVAASGSQTDVGSSDNTYTVSWGTAKESNYTLSEDLGTLEVTPATLTVTTGSDTKMYDGEALTCGEASLSGLVAGETATVTASGSQTEVGSSDNTYTISWGTAKESNYTLSEDLGTLEVTENIYMSAITITSASKTAEYNGEELSDPNYEVSGLPDGYEAIVEISGGQQDVGTSANTIAFYQIVNGSEDVTSLFTNVTLTEGTLTVTAYELSFDCGCGEYTYGDDILTPTVSCNGMSQTGEVGGDGSVVAAFTLDTGDTVYLRMEGYPSDCESIGEIDTHPYFSVNPGQEGNYTASYSSSIITINKKSVTVSTPNREMTYNGEPYPMCTDSLSDNPELYEAWEGGSGDENIDAGTYDNIVGFEILDSEKAENYEFTLNPGTITIKPASLVLRSEEKEKTYDGEPLTLLDDDVTLIGLMPVDGIEFILKNNTVTKGGTGVEPDFDIEWMDTNQKNYEVTNDLGRLLVNKAPLIITTGDAEKDYDGTPLQSEAGAYTISGTVYGSDSIEVIITGSQTEVGYSDNTFEIDYENSVNADCYEITPDYGTLTVNPAPENTDSGKIAMVFTLSWTKNTDDSDPAWYDMSATMSLNGESSLPYESRMSDEGRQYDARFATDDGDVRITITNIPNTNSPESMYYLDCDWLFESIREGVNADSYSGDFRNTTIKFDKSE